MDKNQAYIILSDLIYKGFLVTELELAGIPFIFKTINEKEYGLIKLHSGAPNKSNYTEKFNLNFLSYSTLAIDAYNILLKRDEKIRELYSFFSNMPYLLYNRIMTELTELRQLSYEAVGFLEGFSYTEQSRRRWQVMNSTLPNNETVTGIPGTGRIGLNTFQESWSLINQMLDKEERYSHDFSLAVLISSASNPKGAKAVRARHDASLQRTEERRKKLAQVGALKKTQWSPQGWAAPVDTADDLVEELKRQMTGMKDRHDLFIEDHIRDIQEEAKEQELQAQKRLEELRKKREEEGVSAMAITGEQRILTPEETRNLMSRNKSNNLMIVQSDEKATEKDNERYLSKMGDKIITGKH